MQQFLSAVYVIQLTEAYKQNEPLFNCNVIFQDVCGYRIYLEPYIQTVLVFTDNKGKKKKVADRQQEFTLTKDHDRFYSSMESIY
jgi:hypothetical protein